MNKKRRFIMVLLILSGFCGFAEGGALEGHPATDAYGGWRLGIQGWTFNRFTFYETVDKAASVGLDWIEAYPGQRLSKERPEMGFGPGMPSEVMREVKAKLADAGVRVVNFGVVGLGNDEKACREVFDFAKEMGIETLVSEPPEEAFDMIEGLCKEYKISVAIHNHPKPSHYWDPDTVLKAVEGRSKWIGACADTGHWMRSGIEPLEALKKLEGRIISLHFKDLNEFGNPEAHDVVWGTGKADVRGLLEELERQGFAGVFSIEYEHNWENSLPEVRSCVEYFNKTAGELDSKSALLEVNEKWPLCIAAWSYNKFTFYEMVDKIAALGQDKLEAFSFTPEWGQQLSKETGDVKFHHGMAKELREKAKGKLKEAGVRLVNCYMLDLPNDEAKCREIFEFAREMGIETMVAEPNEEALDLVERLCKEYEVKVAIHNHPKPSSYYWHPEKVMEVCRGRSEWIGACPDTGHYMRTGLNPVEMLRILEGRIMVVHFKDLDRFGDAKAPDVVWGTGVGDVRAMLAELSRQGFEGMISVELEQEGEDASEAIRRSIEYFNETSAELKRGGWHDLLTDDLRNFTFKPGNWAVEEGVLTRKGGGDIWTKERFGDFILDLEFKLARGANSGVFLRTGGIKEWLHTSIEVQILDYYANDSSKHGQCGAIYDCLSPSKEMVKKSGEWNHYTIMCKANKIYVVLNGEQIIDMDLDLWTEAHKNPDGTANKFNTAYKDMPRAGHIGLQDHGNPIWFRNIKIKML